MRDVKQFYNERSEIYTTSLQEQTNDEAVNSILWRLAVAVGLANEGDGVLFVDPDELLELAEDVIWRYKELEN